MLVAPPSTAPQLPVPLGHRGLTPASAAASETVRSGFHQRGPAVILGPGLVSGSRGRGAAAARWTPAVQMRKGDPCRGGEPSTPRLLALGTVE